MTVPGADLFDLSPAGEAMVEAAARIGEQVARPAADDVDRLSRFPHETISALRDERMLSALVPTSIGGGGATIADIAAVCFSLGQHCGSSAMVFAMHQIQVSCLVRHGMRADDLSAYLRELVDQQRLIASATTEAGVGGDVRTSLCSVSIEGDTYSIEKETPVISYGDHADDILVTARRSADAANSDQVIVLARKPDVTLEATGTWDTLGMRGTCSTPFRLKATGPATHIVPQPYAEISAQTMLPVSHIVWAALWLGISTDAANIARTYLRAAARKSPGTVPANAPEVAQLFAELETVRATVASAVRLYHGACNTPSELERPGLTLRMNSLKTSVSTAAVRVVMAALDICGIAGYKNDTPYSLGRHLRDVHSAAVMVHNQRILANSGALLCVYKGD